MKNSIHRVGTGQRNSKNIVLTESCTINSTPYSIPDTALCDILPLYGNSLIYSIQRAVGVLSGLKI